MKRAIIATTGALAVAVTLTLHAQPIPKSFTFGKKTVLKCTCEGSACQCAEQPSNGATESVSVLPRRSSVMATTIAYPTWDSCGSLTFPPNHTAVAPRVGISVILDAQLKSDTNIANRWSIDANATCKCDGYKWLGCNGAAYRDWHDHANGEDPIVYFCKQGYDSPLATYNERFSLNRTIDEIGFTVVEVWFNAKKFEGRILPADCLAGCTVYADIPCEVPRQATVITLREPAHDQYDACYTYSADGKARMRMWRCPPREVK